MTNKQSAVTEWHELRERVAVALWIHHGAMLHEFRIRSDWSQVSHTMKRNMLRHAQTHITQLRCLDIAVENVSRKQMEEKTHDKEKNINSQ